MATVESPQPQNAVADFVECCLWRLSAGVIWYLPVAVLLYTATGESLLPFSMWLLLFPLAAMFWNVK
ncbi:MAG TPA: hypothetical protein VFA18_01690, partial [Gemmataceae bacterium]|nr:hypothetical protein [Gemmataceae bacterium]